MDTLKEMYEDLQFINVQTYIQSGNVVFQCNKPEQKDLELIISNQIVNKFGFEVLVIVFEISEFKSIIERNTLATDKTKDTSRLYVTFLSYKPEGVNIENIYQYKSPEEEIVITEKAVYLYCPSGYGKTKLSNTFFENKLKVGATTRNWKTTTELLKIAEEQY